MRRPWPACWPAEAAAAGEEEPKKGQRPRMAHRGSADGVHPRLSAPPLLCRARGARHGQPSACPGGSASETPPNRLTVDVRVPETSPAIEIDVRGPQAKGWLETTLEPRGALRRGYYDVLRLTDGPASNRFARPLWLLAFLGGCVGVALDRVAPHQHQRVLAAPLLQEPARALLSRRQPERQAAAEPADRLRSGRRLSRCRRCSPDCQPSAYHGPYPIVNTTLNLNAGSRAGAAGAQGGLVRLHAGVLRLRAVAVETKTSTPSATTSGLDRDGYRPDEGLRLSRRARASGTTVAISGAAANPNSGLHDVGADGVPAHRVRRAARLVARQPALAGGEPASGPVVRAVVPARRAARPDDGAHASS